MVEKKSMYLKVYKNKKNGQGIVLLPKKKMPKIIPNKIKISW